MLDPIPSADPNEPLVSRPMVPRICTDQVELELNTQDRQLYPCACSDMPHLHGVSFTANLPFCVEVYLSQTVDPAHLLAVDGQGLAPQLRAAEPRRICQLRRSRDWMRSIHPLGEEVRPSTDIPGFDSTDVGDCFLDG